MSVQANELRIGNAIWDDTRNKIKWVNHRVISDIASNNNPLPYSPIRLTHEIFKKCGFEIIGEGEDEIIIRKGKLGMEPDLCLRYECSWNGFSKGYRLNVQNFDASYEGNLYLHQLQNLYFALTGEELEYKP